jgi:hypothetical protein
MLVHIRERAPQSRDLLFPLRTQSAARSFQCGFLRRISHSLFARRQRFELLLAMNRVHHIVEVQESASHARNASQGRVNIVSKA